MSGYTGPIISVDFSPTAIADLSLKHEGLPMLQYEVADVRNMPQYPTAFFDAVLDKGTLDALMCGDQADTNVDDMLQEASRVLRPGGCLIEVTYGSPGSRLPRLDDPDFGWTVAIYTIEKLRILSSHSPKSKAAKARKLLAHCKGGPVAAVEAAAGVPSDEVPEASVADGSAAMAVAATEPSADELSAVSEARVESVDLDAAAGKQYVHGQRDATQHQTAPSEAQPSSELPVQGKTVTTAPKTSAAPAQQNVMQRMEAAGSEQPWRDTDHYAASEDLPVDSTPPAKQPQPEGIYKPATGPRGLAPAHEAAAGACSLGQQQTAVLPPHIQGPFTPGSKDVIDLLINDDLHFVYVCHKAGPSTQSAQHVTGLRLS